MKRPWRWFVLACALACSEEEAAAPPPLEIETESFPLAFVRAGCARTESCCAASWSAITKADAPARCEVMDEFSAALMGDLEMAVKSGRATYDAPSAERCVRMIAAAACNARIDVTRVDAIGGACAQAVRGHVGLGGACQSSWDCSPGLYCDADPLATPRCVSRRPSGAPCASEAECASGRCDERACGDRLPLCATD